MQEQSEFSEVWRQWSEAKLMAASNALQIYPIKAIGTREIFLEVLHPLSILPKIFFYKS